MTYFDARQHVLRLVFILGGITALTPLAVDMYIPAFPQMAQAFGVPVSNIELSITTFFIGLAIGQLFYGTIADKFGRKKPLYVGMTLAIVATFACAFIHDPELFLAFRFIQALGICSGAVIARAMVRDLFDHRESARFFSFLILVMGVAPILAPLAGGYIAEYAGWNYIFLAIGTFATLLLLVVIFALPETNKGNPEIRLMRSIPAYIEVLKDRAFLRYCLCGSFIMAGMFAYVTGSPFVFIEHFGIPADHFGWVFGANALGFITMSQVNRYLVQNFDLEKILRTGLSVIVLATLALITTGLLHLGPIAFGISLFCYIAPMGIVLPNSFAIALAEQGHRAGTASAMMGSIQFTLAFLSSATIGLIHATTEAPLGLTVAAFGLLGVFIYALPLIRKRAPLSQP